MGNLNGVIDQTTGEATVKTGSDSLVDPGTVVPQGSQGQQDNAGGSQGSSESGKEQGTDQGRPRFKSKQETIYELRQQSRERESYWTNEVGTLKQQLAEIQKHLKPGQEQKPLRTFWDAPEDVQREIHREELKAFKDDLLGELRQTQEQREQAQTLRQEASEAAKFIRATKGITDDDIQEIRELLASDPTAQRLADSPMEQAEYVLYRFEKLRGVTDKSALKNKAAGAQGSAGGFGGPKVWTETEMELEMKKLGDPKDWTPETRKKFKEMEQEFMSAYAQKRVKK